MTTVVVTPSVAYVEVSDSMGVNTVIEVNTTATVELITEGPQGPPGAEIPVLLNQPVTGSFLYYDAAVELFRADSTHTTSNLLDGGNA